MMNSFMACSFKFFGVVYDLWLMFLCVFRLQLIDDLTYEDVKKCYRGSVSSSHISLILMNKSIRSVGRARWRLNITNLFPFDFIQSLHAVRCVEASGARHTWTVKPSWLLSGREVSSGSFPSLGERWLMLQEDVSLFNTRWNHTLTDLQLNFCVINVREQARPIGSQHVWRVK